MTSEINGFANCVLLSFLFFNSFFPFKLNKIKLTMTSEINGFANCVLLFFF